MRGFDRLPDGYAADVDEFEAELLASLVGQVTELLGGSGDVRSADDPFAQWEGEFAPSAALDHADPVIRRLFPDASDDDLLAAEHRRLTEETLRRERIADGALVLADLDAVERGRLVVSSAHLDAWLRTLNAVRLSLSVRLGVESDADVAALQRLPRRDPRFQLGVLFDWLGLVLESLLDAAD